MRIICPSTLLFLATLLGTASASEAKNVIFILADDYGWADSTLYGHTNLYPTPNIDRLASRGMTFSRAYSNSPLCSPTRASVLTGQLPTRHGSTNPQHHLKTERLKASVADKGNPGDKLLAVSSVTRLDTAWPTLGKQLNQAGYATGHFGKWHLGREPYTPLEHGFDIDVPHWPGAGPGGWFIAPWLFPSFKANFPKEHIEDRMADEATDWLSQLDGEAPFYLNYWMFSVHAPFDAKQSLIDHYRGKIDLDSPQRSPLYAAMVHSLDDAIGSLLDHVDAADIAEETIIIFISDNGGNQHSGINEWDTEGNEYLTPPTSNAPLRGGKATIFEGGIRVPCVVVWPGLTEPGSRSDEVIQTSDFYPTLHAQLGMDLPENHVIDGIDITPALEGGSLDREAIFTYFPHNPKVPNWLPPSISVHVGDWKLIRLFHYGEDGAHDYHLYDLSNDIGENTNLAQSHPEKVAQLDALIEQHIQETGAIVPLPNPSFDPAQYRPEEIGVQPGGLKKARQRQG